MRLEVIVVGASSLSFSNTKNKIKFCYFQLIVNILPSSGQGTILKPRRQEELAYFISVLDCVYSNHITDGIKVESRIIRYSQRGLLEKIQLH